MIKLRIKLLIKQAFDSIAGNTVVPYRSLKKFFNYHTLLFIAIYNYFQVEVCICIIATYWHTTFYAPNFDKKNIFCYHRIQNSTNSWTDGQTNRQGEKTKCSAYMHIVHIATYLCIKFHAPSFNSFKVIKGSRFLADRQTDGLTDGQRANL